MTVTINSFPPAKFVDDSTLSFYESLHQLIGYLALAFAIINYLVVPNKYGLHSASLSWMVPYLYIVYFHSTAYTTQWISSSAAGLRHQALSGGLSFGDCCWQDTFQGTTSQVFTNMGFILLMLLAGWSLLGCASLVQRCSGSDLVRKLANKLRYYLFTLHLVVFLQLCYFCLYALANYQLNNQVDAANTTLSLFFLFSCSFFVASVWYLTAVNKF